MRNIIAENDAYTLEGKVADDADLDGVFVLQTDDGPLRVNGWLFTIEVVS